MRRPSHHRAKGKARHGTQKCAREESGSSRLSNRASANEQRVNTIRRRKNHVVDLVWRRNAGRKELNDAA